MRSSQGLKQRDLQLLSVGSLKAKLENKAYFLVLYLENNPKKQEREKPVEESCVKLTIAMNF